MASNLSKTANYVNYVRWLGRVREIGLQPIGARMAEQFATIKMGVVTNFTETRIFNEVSFGEVVEALFWANQVSDSSIEAYAFWRTRLPDGSYRPLALSRQLVTVVAILAHGVVEPRPLPDYMVKFLDDMIQIAEKISYGGMPIAEIEALYDGSLVGDSRQRMKIVPGKPGCLIASQIYETDQIDSNAVGNVYFSNYSVWQAKQVDRIVRSALPAPVANEEGELRGGLVRVSHLREAMPFDTIEVKTYIAELFERGVTLNFEFFKVQSDASREKLATGTYTGVWFARDAKGQWSSAKLPQALANALTRSVGITNLVGAA